MKKIIKANTQLTLSHNADNLVTLWRENRMNNSRELWTTRYNEEYTAGKRLDPGSKLFIDIRAAIREGNTTKNAIYNYMPYERQKEIDAAVRSMHRMLILNIQ